MNERRRSGLIKTLLDKVVRIETEPHEAALNRHLRRMDELDEQRLVLWVNINVGDRAATEARFSALHDIEKEYSQRQVGELTPIRELVIFNSKRLAL